MEKLGIEELKDVFDYGDAVLEQLKKHKADDGKIDTAELMQTGMVTAPAGIEAFIGSGQIMAELKDLDADETREIAGRAIAIIAAVASLAGFGG